MKKFIYALAIALGLVALTACGDLSSTSSTQKTQTPAVVQEQPAAPAEQPAAPVEEAPVVEEGTVSQRNALEQAQSYLEFSGFSEAGLFDQLTSEYGGQFSKADAKWAIARLDVDWNQEAVEAAESYLEFSSFSRNGLIDQLTSPYGGQFTKAQALYAVKAVGL